MVVAVLFDILSENNDNLKWKYSYLRGVLINF